MTDQLDDVGVNSSTKKCHGPTSMETVSRDLMQVDASKMEHVVCSAMEGRCNVPQLHLTGSGAIKNCVQGSVWWAVVLMQVCHATGQSLNRANIRVLGAPMANGLATNCILLIRVCQESKGSRMQQREGSRGRKASGALVKNNIAEAKGDTAGLIGAKGVLARATEVEEANGSHVSHHSCEAFSKGLIRAALHKTERNRFDMRGSWVIMFPTRKLLGKMILQLVWGNQVMVFGPQTGHHLADGV